MRIIDALLAALLLAGLLGLLESLSRRFWATRWTARGFSSQWLTRKHTTIRVAASITSALIAGISFDSVYAFTGFAALAWLAALSISTDLADMKIPSEPVWTVLWIALLAASAENALQGNIAGRATALTDMVIAEAVVLGIMLLTALVTRGGIGSGDVRLVAALTISTAWLGAGAIMPALALAAGGYLATRRILQIPLGTSSDEGQPVPFAPGLVAGYATVAATVAFISLLSA